MLTSKTIEGITFVKGLTYKIHSDHNIYYWHILAVKKDGLWVETNKFLHNNNIKWYVKRGWVSLSKESNVRKLLDKVKLA